MHKALMVQLCSFLNTATIVSYLLIIATICVEILYSADFVVQLLMYCVYVYIHDCVCISW